MAGQAEKFIQQTAYMKHGNTLYGRTNGIFFNVQYANLSIAATVRAYIKRGEGIDLFGIKAFLKGAKKYHPTDAQTDGRSVWVTLNSATVLRAETVVEFVNMFSSFLVDNGYSSSCSFCANTENLGYTEQNGEVIEACEACHANLQGAVEQIKTERDTTGSYAKGALGAAGGGLIGIIPWVLPGMLGYVAAISGFIMAWLAYKGYQMAHGRRSKGMVWILIVVLIVFTYVGVMANTYVGAVREVQAQGYELVDNAFWIIMGLPFSPGEDVGMLWGQLALGWLFAGLGSFGLIRRANHEGAGKDIDVKRIDR